MNNKHICEVNDDNLPLFKSLGKAVGLDIEHCLWLGNRYCPDFFQRVCGYRITGNEESVKVSEATGQKYICVEFFEQKDAVAGEQQNKSIGFCVEKTV